MLVKSIWSLACLAAAAVLGGCVADTPLSVAPGQGKSYADLQRDDTSCRGTPAPAPAAATTTPSAAATAPASNYYQCMAAKGELVVSTRPVAYPAYAPYPYYPYAYPYGYPFYGYPYPAAYYGPFIGVGVGFGFGGRYYGGYHGGYGGGYHGGGYHR